MREGGGGEVRSVKGQQGERLASKEGALQCCRLPPPQAAQRSQSMKWEEREEQGQ